MSHRDIGPAEATWSYWSGNWFGILGDRAMVILPPTEKSRVAEIWELVDGGAGFDVTLDALISTGLRELPGFVLVSTAEGETRVVLRGPASAVFTVEDETVELEGSAATTWVERSLVGVQEMTITLTADAGALPERAPYVVDGGLFRVARLREAPAHEGLPEYASRPAESYLEIDAGEDTGDYVEDLSVRSPEPPSWTPAPMSAADADHDGLTIMGGAEPVAPPPPGIPGQPPAPDVTRPIARLVISNGETIEVDRAIVIGRSPVARRFGATEQPRLVTVPSPHLEISATHLEVRPGSGADHGSAVVTDLGSTNGTVLVQPGLGPEDLEAGVAVQLIPGAVIDLGDGVTIQVSRA